MCEALRSPLAFLASDGGTPGRGGLSPLTEEGSNKRWCSAGRLRPDVSVHPSHTHSSHTSPSPSPLHVSPPTPCSRPCRCGAALATIRIGLGLSPVGATGSGGGEAGRFGPLIDLGCFSLLVNAPFLSLPMSCLMKCFCPFISHAVQSPPGCRWRFVSTLSTLLGYTCTVTRCISFQFIE